MTTATTFISLSRVLVLLWLAAAAASVQAESEPAGCRSALAQEVPFMDREGALARFESLPDPCLKVLFRQCAAVAGQQMLDGDSAARCSVGYEALLRRSFRGDFHALLAWWRSERGQTR